MTAAIINYVTDLPALTLGFCLLDLLLRTCFRFQAVLLLQPLVHTAIKVNNTLVGYWLHHLTLPSHNVLIN